MHHVLLTIYIWDQLTRLPHDIRLNHVSGIILNFTFCLLYIHINNTKFTYDKLKSVISDSAYSITLVKFYGIYLLS